MNLPTIVVCDNAAGKKEEIEGLISAQPSLILLGTVSRQAASQQTLQQGIKVIWLELAPDPQKGLALLGELREKYPKVHYLVSYETLQADLVKTAMQLGAVEYLDMPGAAQLLPPAIGRINSKEHTATTAAAGAPPQAPLASSRPSATQDNLQALPAGQGSIAQGRTERTTSAPAAEKATGSSLRKARNLTTEGDPNSVFASLPNWLLPAIMIIMVLVVVGVMIMNH